MNAHASQDATARDAAAQDAPAPAYECHDCGELYAAGASTASCVDAGHYVGPIVDCELQRTASPTT